MWDPTRSRGGTCPPFDKARAGETPQVPQSALITIPCTEIDGRAPDSRLAFQTREFRLDGGRNLLRHGLLHIQDVRERQIVRLPPQVMTSFTGNHIGCDPHALRLLRHGSLNQISDAQGRTDVSRVRVLVLVCNGGMATEHVEPAVAGKQPDHVLGEAVAEVIRVMLLAQIGERQHRDRRFVGRGNRFP